MHWNITKNLFIEDWTDWLSMQTEWFWLFCGLCALTDDAADVIAGFMLL